LHARETAILPAGGSLTGMMNGLIPSEPDDTSWNFNGANTQYGTHGLHTYVAAMIPQLADRLIQMYVPKNGSVLDPFCGGGAVLVEAVRLNKPAAGRDINDLAVLISRAKTRHVPREQIEDARRGIIGKALSYDGEVMQFGRWDYIDFWFKPYMLKPLTALRHSIDEVTGTNRDLHTLFRTVFSRTVRDVSLTYRNEVRLRRMTPSEVERFNPDVLERFDERAREAAERVSKLPAGSSADVGKGDVRRLPFRDGEFTTIICSPPYGDERNGVNYTQFGKNMLLWLGYTRQDLMESKRGTLGWHKDGKTAPYSRTLAETLERIHDNEEAHRHAVTFYADYQIALREMARVTSDRIIIVIGQRVLHNTVFDNGSITIDLMKNLDVPLEAHFHRQLPSKRLPKMRQFGAAIDRESILVFRK